MSPIHNENDIINSIIHPTTKFETGLSDFDIEKIVDAAEQAMPEGGIDMREIKGNVEVNPNAELESEVVESINTNSGTRVGFVSGPGVANVSLFDIDGDKIPDADKKVIESTANTAKDTFDLSDEEVFMMMDTLTKMKNNPNYPVYINLPKKVQTIIAKLAYDNKIPIANLEGVAKTMMEEFMKEAGIDNTLIDLEKAIDEALQIPSIMDLYTDHTKNVFENIIPETVEKIKDEFPDKARMLTEVKHAFQDSYTYAKMMSEYCSNARLRKTIRRWETETFKVLDRFNYMNSKTNFKMNDVNLTLEVLKQILINDPNISAAIHDENNSNIPEIDTKLIEMNITIEDIHKFVILLCKHCENLNPTNVVDASYMYYLVRNIIALRYANEAKTDFSAQLINNICNVITFIRVKESEFNESGLVKSKSSKKSNSSKR